MERNQYGNGEEVCSVIRACYGDGRNQENRSKNCILSQVAKPDTARVGRESQRQQELSEQDRILRDKRDIFTVPAI